MRAFETEKTDVAEVDRSIYDIKDLSLIHISEPTRP